MSVDIERACSECGAAYWWTAGEQEFYRDRGLVPPARCKECRRANRSRRAEGSDHEFATLVRRRPVHTLAPTEADLSVIPAGTALLNRRALFADLEQLLSETTAPLIVPRRRTFFEWLGRVDLKDKEISDKIRAANRIDTLVQRRTRLFKDLYEMFEVATDARLTRTEKLARIRQEEIKVFELEERIQQRQALASARLRTQELEETTRHRRLLTQIQPPRSAEKRDPGKVAADSHRQHLRYKSEARQTILSDFLREIDRVCSGPASVQEKALRVREVLDAFEMGEEALPEYASRLLRAAERLRDASESRSSSSR